MFCTKCGAEIAPNSKFCTTCGATVDAAAPATTPVQPQAAPVYTAPQAPAPAPAQPKEERAKVDAASVKATLVETLKPAGNFIKKIWANKIVSLSIILGVALILVVGIVGTVLNLTGYKSALNNFVDVMNGDASKLEKVMPNEYWEYMDEEYNKELDDYVEEFEDEYDDYVKELRGEFGKNIKFSYEIEEAEKMDKDDVEDLAEGLADEFSYIDEDDVKEAYEVEMEMTIKGSKDDDSIEMDVLCVKIGSGWYLIRSGGSGDYVYYAFLFDSFM